MTINTIPPPARTAATPALAPAKPAAPPADLAKAAQAFEAIFMRQMIGAMRSAKLADDPLNNAAATQFRDMADARTADAMTQGAGLGIASLLLSQWQGVPK